MNVQVKIAELYKQQSPLLNYLGDLDTALLNRAYANTSHSPEKRGFQENLSYATGIVDDFNFVESSINGAINRGATIDPNWISLFNTWKSEHREKSKRLCTAYLHAHSSCFSWFITGRSNFNTVRHAKANKSADLRYTEYSEGRKGSIRAFLKLVLPYGDGSIINSKDPDCLNKLKLKLKNLIDSQEAMKAANSCYRKNKRKNAKLECYHKELASILGCSLGDNQFDYSQQPFPSYSLSNNLQNIKSVERRIKEEELKNSNPIDDEFNNGISVHLEDGLICINFGYKPDEKVRGFLKSKAFKYSPKRGSSWVRKHTLNALAVYNRDVQPFLEAIE